MSAAHGDCGRSLSILADRRRQIDQSYNLPATDRSMSPNSGMRPANFLCRIYTTFCYSLSLLSLLFKQNRSSIYAHREPSNGREKEPICHLKLDQLNIFWIGWFTSIDVPMHVRSDIQMANLLDDNSNTVNSNIICQFTQYLLYLPRSIILSSNNIMVCI